MVLKQKIVDPIVVIAQVVVVSRVDSDLAVVEYSIVQIDSYCLAGVACQVGLIVVILAVVAYQVEMVNQAD